MRNVAHFGQYLKLVSAIFDQIFIFNQMIALQKLWKNVFYFIVFPSSPLFLPVSLWVRGCLKINLKVYDVINCVNMNLITHFICYLGKEKRYDIETVSIDRVWTFLWKNHAENGHQKLVPDLFFILVNNPKQSLHARNSFKNKIFWKKIIKNP